MKINQEISKKQLVWGGVILFVIIAMFSGGDPSTTEVIEDATVESQVEVGQTKNEGATSDDEAIVEDTEEQKTAIESESQPEAQITEDVQTNQTLSIGEVGIVSNNENSTDCSGKTTFGITLEALRESIDAQIANDRVGYMELAGQGKIFFVENCTSVLKIGAGGTLSSVAEVRIIDHPIYGQTKGWIPYEFAIKSF